MQSFSMTEPDQVRGYRTAGHIDHGKSALVRALTGIDPDRWPEEKRRGITIDLGFANLEPGGPGGEVHSGSASSMCPATSALSATCWPGPDASGL